MLPAAPAIQNTQSTLRPTISARNVEYTGCSQRLCIDKILQAPNTRSASERMCATRQAHGMRSAQKGKEHVHNHRPQDRDQRREEHLDDDRVCGA